MSSATAPIVEKESGKSSPNKGKTPTKKQQKSQSDLDAIVDQTDKLQESADAAVVELLVDDKKYFAEIATSREGHVQATLDYAAFIKSAEDQLKTTYTGLKVQPWDVFQEECKIGASSVYKWLAIANHKPINAAKNLKYLPSSFVILYTIASRMAKDDENGYDLFNNTSKSVTEKVDTINPEMTRGDIDKMAPAKKHESKPEPEIEPEPKPEPKPETTAKDAIDAAHKAAGPSAAYLTDDDPDYFAKLAAAAAGEPVANFDAEIFEQGTDLLERLPEIANFRWVITPQDEDADSYTWMVELRPVELGPVA